MARRNWTVSSNLAGTPEDPRHQMSEWEWWRFTHDAYDPLPHRYFGAFPILVPGPQEEPMTRASLPLRMAAAMEERLIANSHKGSWRRETPYWLLRRLREEVTELDGVVRKGLSEEDVWREATDVANFAAMIADVYVPRKDDARDL